jgi:DNA-binding winged helix-turn-helix (wHTH) protein/TolB-like protein/Tfp pilus assembly protein PilF
VIVSEKPAYQFGPFRLDAGDRLLFKNGELLPLPPKAIDTLLALVVNHGRVVEKDELLKTVWPDTFVEEGGLARNISALRKALGDTGDESQYIETIPKRGYRFVADVRQADEVPAEKQVPRRRRGWKLPVAAAAVLLVAAAWFWHADRARHTARGVRSIAVLPLRDLSNDPAQKYLSDGMTEVLTTTLARVRSLRVIAPASVMRRGREVPPLAEIARDFQADAAIQGAVLPSANRVRVTVQLIDTRTGWLLWGATYDRDRGDVLAFEGELAEAIAREVDVKLTPEERQSLAAAGPTGAAASDAYLRGRYCWNRRTEEGLRQAVRYFLEAAGKDPKYALAYAGLADSYALLGSNGYDAMPPREAMPLARAAAERALALDPGLAEARTTLGYVALAYDWNLEAAGAHFRAALDLRPAYATAHHWYGHYWLAAGQPGKAIAEMKRAQELQPVSLPIMVGVGWSYYFARKYDAAIEQYRKALDLDPNFALAHQTLGMALERKGLRREAVAELERAVELSGGSPSAVAFLGAAYGEAGCRRKAAEQIERLRRTAAQRYVPAILFATAYLGTGNRAEVEQWFRKGIEERSEYFVYLRADPGFESLLTDPGLAAALPQELRRPL